ncbi:PH domain-containing protein [Azomonas macrocytogenes]|uniref:Uncharacterized protein YyaB-like PH domain-containing protein n=1 Tax=Azomonas macrocytogenes TaxID=69962 RepID=A0A839SXD4_AZOMA|nr:PH domain-containing protein [Azomonas macrocytogenes]MBB3101772.1 hypothetical protein [Azomonas macrocytogenes]
MSTYKSKVDTGFAAILLVIAIVSLYITWLLTQAPNPPLWFIPTVTLFLGAVLPLWVLRATRYSINNDALLIVSGPFRWTVPFSQIKDVAPVRARCSSYSPALSLDRLRIEYADDKTLLVSPENRDQFLKDLQERRPATA